jgi:hypothetical protein
MHKNVKNRKSHSQGVESGLSCEEAKIRFRIFYLFSPSKILKIEVIMLLLFQAGVKFSVLVLSFGVTLGGVALKV